MWFENVYDSDPYEEAFEIADFERRLRRERQFDAYDVCNFERPSNIIFGNLFDKLNVSLFVSQDGIVKLRMFFSKI